MNQAWVDAQSAVTVAVRGVKAMGVDLSRIREGYEVALRAEPTNPHDPRAIQVVAYYGGREVLEGGHVLGYLPRDWAAVLRAEDWTATVTAVLAHRGHPAGLRLRLDRRTDESPQRPACPGSGQGRPRRASSTWSAVSRYDS